MCLSFHWNFWNLFFYFITFYCLWVTSKYKLAKNMAKETFILQTNSCDKWVWPDVFLFGLSRKKSEELLFPVHTDFLWIKPCQHYMGWERSFVKVKHWSFTVKFQYYYCWLANTLELLFHMVENLKRCMKIIKSPMYTDLISLALGFLNVLNHSRLVLSEILMCRNKPYRCGLATSGADQLTAMPSRDKGLPRRC